MKAIRHASMMIETVTAMPALAPRARADVGELGAGAAVGRAVVVFGFSGLLGFSVCFVSSYQDGLTCQELG